MSVIAKKNTLFPAQAGVIPKVSMITLPSFAVPRASGGDPTYFGTTPEESDCSPLKRG